MTLPPATSRQPSSRRRAPGGVLVAALLCLAAAGCGSTAPQDGRPVAADGLDALPGTTDTSISPSGAPASNAPGAPGRVGPGATGTPGSAVPAGAPTRPGGRGNGVPVVNGPGVTASTISVGILYPVNQNNAQSALGNSNGQADTRAILKILIDDANAHGGFAGRRVVPVFHAVDATSSQTKAQQAAAACADFTEDHKVFAALPIVDENLLACLHRKGAVAVMAGNIAGGTTAEYRSRPESFDVSAISVERLARGLVPTLVKAGYFSGWDTGAGKPGNAAAKIGLLFPDLPRFRVAGKVLADELRRAGHPVEASNIAYFYWPRSTAESGQAVSSIQSYVLKFRSAGVTHVIPFEQNGMAFFSSGADKQQYRPRYGLSSATDAQLFLGTLIPHAQMAGAVGLGFFPNIDLPASANPDNGPYSTPARQACLALLRRHGQSFSGPTAQTQGLGMCDAVWTLRTVLGRVPQDVGLTQSSVSAALDRLGTVPSAMLTTFTYGPGRRDAITGGWVWRYDGGCSCMGYTGNRFSLP